MADTTFRTISLSKVLEQGKGVLHVNGSPKGTYNYSQGAIVVDDNSGDYWLKYGNNPNDWDKLVRESTIMKVLNSENLRFSGGQAYMTEYTDDNKEVVSGYRQFWLVDGGITTGELVKTLS